VALIGEGVISQLIKRLYQATLSSDFIKRLYQATLSSDNALKAFWVDV
jgi:hypothetical protein